MKILTNMSIFFCVLCLLAPSAALAGKGYMGGKGEIVVEEEAPPDVPPDGGIPDTVEGPLNDNMADSGKLFGDLYRILRQQGVANDKKLVPAVDELGMPIFGGTNSFSYTIDGVSYTYDVEVQLFDEVVNDTTTLDAVVGGEPVLTVIDPGDVNNFSDYGWYAAEVGVIVDPVDETETSVYGAAQSPYPCQCVQPVADYARWGDISAKTGLTKNRLPMVVTYDATWNRSECAVGKLSSGVTADPVTGELWIPIDIWFIEPGEKWTDPVNGEVTYPDGVLWTDLVGEVGFGRLNIGRSPDAVLQAAFDEAVNNLNDPDTIAIEIDAAGRILLTKNVYDPILVDPDTGLPELIGTVKKAIDSPLCNVALYVKLIQDGHLVTPGVEREPIDRSKFGGIPLWKMLELEDGPADAVLRPTIDIAKLRDWGLDDLVDVSEVEYYTYYQCVDVNGLAVTCLCWDEDPVQPELDGKWVACENVADRILVVVSSCPEGITCEGPFIGIVTDGDYAPNGTDFNFAASFLAAAADKTGHVSVDMVVYLNSILGINKVLGYSAYDADGLPTADAIDYEKTPVYFNYRPVAGYGRDATFNARGQVASTGGGGSASTYDGSVTVLQGASPSWNEEAVTIMAAKMDPLDPLEVNIFDDIGLGPDAFPNDTQAADNILGFTQQSDDDLSVIRFIHTFQIPSLR